MGPPASDVSRAESKPIVARQDGATTAEYIAILVAVAAVITAILLGPLTSVIGGAVEAAFGCIRVDRTACDGGNGPGTEDPEGGVTDDPTTGPTTDPRDELAEAINDLPEGTEIRDAAGDVVWTVGDELPGDEQVDQVLAALVDVQAYLDATFGRDSLDGEGGAFIVNLDDAGAIDNAFWNGSETSFGPGMATPDVLAHEFGHALDQYTSDLDSGHGLQTATLNESVADMFASNVTGDWAVGEDSAIGTIRDMSEPAHVDDWDDGASSGHGNARITNYAYYNMVEGVGNIGRDASEQILYTAMTDHLASDAGLDDFRNAMLAAAEDLYGADGDEYAGTEAAMAEVGLDGSWTGP